MDGPNMDPAYDEKDPYSMGARAPGAPEQDLSEFEEPLPDIGSNDAETIAKINRRTSPTGRIVGVFIVASALGLGYWAYQNSISYENRMAVLDEAGKLDGEAKLAALRDGYAKTKHEDVKERILLNLGFFRDIQAVPLLIHALDEEGIVRRAAARALTHIGSPAADAAKPKLLEVLPKTDARDKAHVVWALAVLKEPSAVPEILNEFTAGHLQNLQGLDKKPSFDARVITEVVGPQKLASEELIKHKDKAIRTLVAAALSEAANAQAVEPLITLLGDPDIEVVRQAAAGLGRSGDPRAGKPLFALLQKSPSMRQSVLDALSRSTSAPSIAALLGSIDNVDLKRSLVSLLREMHDPRIADLFAEQLENGDEDLRESAALGLAELGDARAIPSLLELAQAEDRTTALDALDALAIIARPEVATALLPMLKDHPGRKASMLKAIGKSGSPTAGAAVLKELGGDDTEAAAFALADLKYEPAYPKLLAMVKKPMGVDFSKPSVATEEVVRNREIAIRAVGRYGKPNAVDALVTIVEDTGDSGKLREIAGAVLGRLAEPKALAEIIAKAKSSAFDESTRTNYVRGLWQANVQSMSGPLTDLLQPSIPAEIRRSAALALGYAADPANDQLLIDLLRNAEVKREAAFAVVLGGSDAAAEELYRQINNDRELREILQDFLAADDVDYFKLVTAHHFASGQVFRRLRVAEILKNGQDEITFSFPWQQVVSRLKLGWDGPDGLTPREVRAKLVDALRGDAPERRRLAAEALGAMGERGLLLAARDQGGPGQEEAAEVLFRQNRGQ